MRRLLGLIVVMTVLGAAADDVGACGDKFLRAGHRVRAGRYVAVYPANILLYMAPGSAAARVQDLEKLVRAAGHTTEVAGTPAALAAALASGRFEIILAGLGEVPELAPGSRAGARPLLVPILIRPSNDEFRAADEAYGCAIRVPVDTKNRALAEIDCQMERRLKPAGR